MNKITKSKITTGFRSDHSLVYFNIIIDNQPRGPGFFKRNNSVILEQTYQDKIKQAIQEITDINRNANPNTLWQIVKGTIRNETIKFTSFKKKNTIKQEVALKYEKDSLEKELIDDPDNKTLLNSIDYKRNELNKIIEIQTNGIILRAIAEWIEGAEKNTKSFSNLKKKRAESKTVTRLIDKNKNELTKPENILNEAKQFYKTLYNKTDTNANTNTDFFPDNVDKILDEPQKQSCEGFFNYR